jgi:hypothetical protein
MLYLPENSTLIANSNSQSENSSSQPVQDIYNALLLETRLRLEDNPNSGFFFLGLLFFVFAVVVKFKLVNRWLGTLSVDFNQWATPLLGFLGLVFVGIGSPLMLRSSRIETNIEYFKDEYQAKNSERMNEMLDFANKRSDSKELTQEDWQVTYEGIASVCNPARD